MKMDLERIGSRHRDNSHHFAAESEALDQIAKEVRVIKLIQNVNNPWSPLWIFKVKLTIICTSIFGIQWLFMDNLDLKCDWRKSTSFGDILLTFHKIARNIAILHDIFMFAKSFTRSWWTTLQIILQEQIRNSKSSSKFFPLKIAISIALNSQLWIHI